MEKERAGGDPAMKWTHLRFGALSIFALGLLAFGIVWGLGIGASTAAHAQSDQHKKPSNVAGYCGCVTATPIATNTPVPPTAINTNTSTAVPPTATAANTNTSVPPTATNTATPVPPTATSTSVPPTATATSVPSTVPPTATSTATSPPAGGPGSCSTCGLMGSAAGASINGVAIALTTGCNTLHAQNQVSLQGTGYSLTAPDFPGIAATGRVTCVGNTASSVGTMSGFNLVLNNVVTIHTDTAQAQVSAVCGAAPSGRTIITNLEVNGVSVGTQFNGAAANQTMPLPNNQGTLTVNEQIASGASLTVNAIHVHTASGQDFIFGTATAAANTGTTTAGCATSTVVAGGPCPCSTPTPVATVSPCNCTPPPPVVCTVTTGGGQTASVAFASLNQVFLKVSLRNATMIHRVIFVRVTNENGTVVLSNVGAFRVQTLANVRLRLLDLVAVSSARAQAGAFRVQLSISPRFTGTVFTTPAFEAQGRHLAKGHVKH
jgi:hypothetical protein